MKEERIALWTRLAALEAKRDKDWVKPETRRRNAVATRKAETRLAGVHKELRGLPRHCFGGRKVLRQGRLGQWRARRAGNALFAGETGKKCGNEVARWDRKNGRLEVKLPGGLRPVVLDGVQFSSKVEEDLRARVDARTAVSWRVKLLARGKVELCVTYEELEPATCTDAANGALALDLNAEHLAATLVSGDGRLLDAWRWDLRADRDNVHSATRMLRLMAARRGVPVVAEDLDLRKKKAWLRQYRRRFAEVLSLFRSRQLMNAVERQCRRRGVELIVVDPAWTTKLAKDGKYPHRYRIGLHHGAALVIARRGPGVCRACVEDRPAPRARRREAPGYARLAEHTRAVAAPRLAQGRSAWREREAGGPGGSRQGGAFGASPARWVTRRHCKSGCRWPGGGCPYSRLTCNGAVG